MTLPVIPKVNLAAKVDLTEPTQAVVEKGLEKVDTALAPIENLWGCVTELTGMALDGMQEWRLRNFHRIRARSLKILEERGTAEPRALRPKQAMKALGAASQEADPALQEMWAQLLANAMDPEKDDLPSSMIDILGDMDPADALALKHLSDLVEKYRLARDEKLDADLAEQLQAKEHTAESEEALRKRFDPPHKDAIDVPLATWAAALGCSEQACLVRAAALSRLACVAAGSQTTGTTFGSIRIPSPTEAESWTVAPLGRELLRWCVPAS
ncbi:MAG: Abi-alpha family protein [Nannocystaceae bacterium]